MPAGRVVDEQVVAHHNRDLEAALRGARGTSGDVVGSSPRAICV